MTDFQSLGVPADMVARLAEAGLTAPTPIQTRAIPAALGGRDVLGLAQTGTGKTVAFGVPLMLALGAAEGKPVPKTPRGLILAPTRELAKQIVAALEPLRGPRKLSVVLVVGGASINAQAGRLARGVDLVVATPGRLMDLMGRRDVDLRQVRQLVLDEADQMLDLGFIHALRRIAAALQPDRRTMLFSATMPKAMESLAASFLTNPLRIEVTPPGRTVERVTQSVHFVTKDEKADRLVNLLDTHRDERAIVFGRTKHGSEKLAKKLEAEGFAVASIHGNKSQGQRDRAIRAFKAGEVRVLVATDVAARGIDIPDVKHVYNFDLPNVPETYVHRIGRTARAGADGAAIAFCTPEEMGELRDIQKVTGLVIPVGHGEPWERHDAPRKKAGRGGGSGRGEQGKPARRPRRSRPPRRANKAA
ncbi:DEAD/DEAH box helicase [Roseibacterium sp. SDUM158016]|jgi:ATP-dependent RNA helicase RhlE|uniref:DEAD/DEAH box helicase n=1 Tax=Roseicyclus sediminis TaxID=2980997 RepID=UPI0021D3B98B|nr:DEAD/DEAH box helicase [Roseibacterium sp. SDUM158016]MCU4654111.1 DEAD/DEAH box helicase [Roseibacterium sp. SDUM158016]